MEASIIEPKGAYRVWPSVPLLRPIGFGSQVIHHHHSTHAQRRQDHLRCRMSLRAARWSFGWSGVEKEEIEGTIGKNFMPVAMKNLRVRLISEKVLNDSCSLSVCLDGDEAGCCVEMREQPGCADACACCDMTILCASPCTSLICLQ